MCDWFSTNLFDSVVCVGFEKFAFLVKILKVLSKLNIPSTASKFFNHWAA